MATYNTEHVSVDTKRICDAIEYGLSAGRNVKVGDRVHWRNGCSKGVRLRKWVQPNGIALSTPISTA
jgi:hypothetical protein